ncbi:hypothetical protein ACWF95_36775 [Streptomyces vinaceus]
MNLVLLDAPLNADRIIELHQELSKKLRGQLPAGRKTTLRVSPLAVAKHREVKQLSDEADFARHGLYVHSALMLNFLTELKVAGPLPPLDIPPLI